MEFGGWLGWEGGCLSLLLFSYVCFDLSSSLGVLRRVFFFFGFWNLEVGWAGWVDSLVVFLSSNWFLDGKIFRSLDFGCIVGIGVLWCLSFGWWWISLVCVLWLLLFLYCVTVRSEFWIDVLVELCLDVSWGFLFLEVTRVLSGAALWIVSFGCCCCFIVFEFAVHFGFFIGVVEEFLEIDRVVGGWLF